MPHVCWRSAITSTLDFISELNWDPMLRDSIAVIKYTSPFLPILVSNFNSIIFSPGVLGYLQLPNPLEFWGLLQLPFLWSFGVFSSSHSSGVLGYLSSSHIPGVLGSFSSSHIPGVLGYFSSSHASQAIKSSHGGLCLSKVFD